MLQFNSKHFLTGEELSQKELLGLLAAAEVLREQRQSASAGLGVYSQPLLGKTIAMIFDKPSLRTRVSFTVGIQELGGQTFELLGSQKKSEEPEDTIRVLQGYVHGVMMRTFSHEYLTRMSSVSRIPIINGLSDTHHPCQALADLQTLLQTFSTLSGLTLAYVGDGNNVLNSLLLMAPFIGVNVHYACPNGYQPDAEILSRAQQRAQMGGARIQSFATPKEAVQGVHAVYTDVWTSMGFESENQARLEAFKGYQLNLDLFKQAHPTAIALHCLPMVRGLEITSDVADHDRSALFQQAENRLHAQKALLLGLFTQAEKKVEKGLEYVD